MNLLTHGMPSCKRATAFLLAFFLFFIAARAQPSIPGYTLLGQYSGNGHYYYRSQTPVFGDSIKHAVANVQSLLAGIAPTQIYAAAISTQGENDFIAAKLLEYNESTYGTGNGKAAYFDWFDNRNAWIGYTDADDEGTTEDGDANSSSYGHGSHFVWSNGEPLCNNFTNWNVQEPNNSWLLEDYTEILIMNDVPNPGIYPFGKWNDYFIHSVPPTDGNPEYPITLPLIIEIGTRDCNPVCCVTTRLSFDFTAFTNASCNGQKDGTASFTITAGQAPFTYNVDGSAETSLSGLSWTANVLAAGTHNITVTDANGLKKKVIFVIGQNTCPLVNLSLTSQVDVKCFGSNTGSATFSISSGQQPFAYQLNGATYSANFNNSSFTIPSLAAGNYTVVVKDKNGTLSAPLPYTIKQPAAALSATYTFVAPKCNGDNNGTATITVSGGTAPYKLTPTNGGPAGSFGNGTTVTISNLKAATYNYTITDAAGCMATTSICVTQPDKIVLTSANIKPACSGNNGSVDISATGGTAPYTGTGSKTGLPAGNNQFTVTDKNGCSQTIAVNIPTGTGYCTPPRDNYGCSFLVWKFAAKDDWDDAGYANTQIFSTVFGITNGRNAVTIGKTTLQNTLDQSILCLIFSFNDYKCLSMQATAALLNAGEGFYPYTSDEIISAVKSMFNKGTASLPAVTVNGKKYPAKSFASCDVDDLSWYLFCLNNLGCHLRVSCSNYSLPNTVSANREDVIALAETEKAFSISGYPNPSHGNFNIQITGPSAETVTVRVLDINGRLIEQKTGVPTNQTLQIGGNYAAGVYSVEVVQGSVRKQLKLVKTN